jgi:hypothetical protein
MTVSYTPVDITEEQRANLDKLATYLESGNMGAYHSSAVSPTAADCGSVGCAVGHGPYAGILKQIGMGWNSYCLLSFGADPGPNGDESKLWSYLFSGCDNREDQTAAGAAARIRTVLESGVPEKSTWYVE